MLTKAFIYLRVCTQIHRTIVGLSLPAASKCFSTVTPLKFVPRRAVMYVPGDDEKKLRKIPALNADCAVLECEDGVAFNRKEAARQTICQVLGEMDFGRSEVSVRINSLESGLADDDLAVILQAKRLPSTILFPKVHSPQHVEWFSERLKFHLSGKQIVDKINLIIYIESGLGLMNLKDICYRAKNLSQDSPFVLDGLVFGSDDYIADIGAVRTEKYKEVMVPRQIIVAAAKAFGLQAIDMVYIDYKDLEGLKKQCIQGAQWGFTGKQVIHPSQLPVVHSAFTPPKEKVEWAKEVIRLFKESQAEGKGVFTFRGSMVDKPLLLQAQNISELADAIAMNASKS